MLTRLLRLFARVEVVVAQTRVSVRYLIPCCSQHDTTGLLLEDRIDHPIFGPGVVARREMHRGLVFVSFDAGSAGWISPLQVELTGVA